MPVQTIHPDKTNPTNPLLDEFLNYVLTIKGYSEKSAQAYRYDLIIFFRFIKRYFAMVPQTLDFGEIPIADVNIDVLKSVNLGILYAFCPIQARSAIMPMPPAAARFHHYARFLIICATNRNTFFPIR